MKNSATEVIEGVKKTNPHNLIKGDKVHFTNGKEVHIGKVSNVYQEHSATKIEIDIYKGNPLKVNANSKNLEPLFTIIEDKKIPLQFTYKEFIEIFNKGSFKTLSFKDLKKTKEQTSSIFTLLKGNQTKVFESVQLSTIPKEGKASEIYEKDVRFELRRSKNNVPFLHREDSRDKLDLSKIYGKTFTKIQVKQLEKTGNLGLVDELINKGTGELFKAWIAVDIGLNKLVAIPEKMINIKKIRGHETTIEEQESLKLGKGIVRGKQYLSFNAGSTSNDGVRTNSLEYAIKNKLPLHIEKKKNLTRSEQKNKTIKI
ncbi:hypothetical protein LNI89_11400 [Tenacibaculum dicentrarchi]|nr:hypothetical protein [Tenacibaculum dicentrarchi]MCD8421084.1 hypothetical protein [Tenacibaculum dicentrarchi]